jgi:hypothetical protein
MRLKIGRIIAQSKEGEKSDDYTSHDERNKYLKQRGGQQCRHHLKAAAKADRK